MYLPPSPSPSPSVTIAILAKTRRRYSNDDDDGVERRRGGGETGERGICYVTSRGMDEDGARTFRSYESSSSYRTLRATRVGRYARGGEIYSDLQSPASRRVTVLIWLLFPTTVRGIGAGRIKSAASPRWITGQMKNLTAPLLDRDQPPRVQSAKR